MPNCKLPTVKMLKNTENVEFIEPFLTGPRMD
jgi:hypothetical protein